MTNQSLIDFIKAQLQLGAGREAITAMLIGQGWTTMDIDEAFATLNTSSVQTSIPTPAPAIPISASPVVGQSPQPHKGRSFSIVIITILIIVCLGGVAAFAWYQFVPRTTPTQILKNALQLTFGHTSSFAFTATSTGSVTSTTTTYGLPSTINFSLTSFGSIDAHSRANPLANVNFTVNAQSANASTSDGLAISADTIYVPKSLYINIKNFNVSYSSTNPQQAGAGLIIAMINGIALKLENQWIQIDASSTIPMTSSTQNGLTQADISSIDNYIFGMSYVSSISNLGVETVNNMKTNHIEATLQDDGQLVALIRQIAPEKQPSLATSTVFESQMDNLTQTLDQPITVDVWIGTADYRIYKITFGPIIFGDTQNSVQSSSNFEASFSDYGLVMPIAAPQGAIPFQQFIQSIMGNMFSASAPTTLGAGYANPNGQSSQSLSASDVVALKDTVQSFRQAFLSNNEQGVLQYSSSASQGTLKINQLNTAYKSLTIKNISGTNTQAEVVMVAVTNSGMNKDITWGFVKENGLWKFDLGFTEQLSQQI